MIDKDLINKACDLWSRAESILIISHEKPDGDAISSLVAMNYILGNIPNRRVHLVSLDGVPEVFNFLPDSGKIDQDFLCGDINLVITLDCGDLRRTGCSDRLLSLSQKNVPIINIDHHPKNDLHRLATINLFDSEAASTTEILYLICETCGIPITANLATCLFTGLYTDTGSFQHPTTDTAVLEFAATLLNKGAKFSDLQKRLIVSKPVAMLKLWGIVLQRMKIHEGGLVVSVVRRDDLKACKASEGDLAGIVTWLESINKCRVAALLTELDNGCIRVSLRSNNSKADVSKIARVFGGGGHTRAAGFTCEGRLIVDKMGWNIV